MKKMIVVLLIVLLIGVAIAAVGFIIACNAAGELDEKSASFDYYAGDNIIVDCTTSDVIVSVGGEGDKLKINYYENKTIKAEVVKNGNDISFIVDKKSNFFIWNAFSKKTAVTVTLPKNFDGNATLKTNTGKIVFDADGITVGKLEAVISTGEMSLNSVTVSDSASIKSATGKISVNNMFVANTLTAGATTGSMDINGVTVGGDLSLNLTTGNVTVAGGKVGGHVSATVTTGKINVEADVKKAVLNSTTGNIDFSLKNCVDVSIKATTGDVSGKIFGLLSEYTVFTSTTTGKSNLGTHTGSVEGKIFKAETTTGDIEVEFV